MPNRREKSGSKINLEKLHTEASTKLININNLHRGSKTKNQDEIEKIMHVRQTKQMKKHISKIEREKEGTESINLDLKAIKKNINRGGVSHTA
jgi:hypothetical protein